MAGHEQTSASITEETHLGSRARGAMGVFAVVGLAGILVSVVLAMSPHVGIGRFYFAWLTAWASALAIALGALFFVLIQHLVAAGWSVTVRRVAEALMMTLPVLGVLSLPILISVLSQKGDLYRWALPLPDHAAMKAEHGTHSVPPAFSPAESPGTHSADAARAEPHGPRVLDELTLKKRAWLNPTFFTARVIFYFVVWSAMALYFWRASVRQDACGDPAITHRLRLVSAPSLVLYGLTLTAAAFDLLMSLDPHWYSTIFGIYYFAGGVVAFFATQILLCLILQRQGLLKRSINIEHYHDLGKYLFGFIFFWGYIAFSQYMLLWYASIPETTPWFARRGATSAIIDVSKWGYVINGWTCLAGIVLLGHLLIPFAALLSRHMKRCRPAMAFWAVWILVFHYLETYWVVMPESVPHASTTFRPAIIDLTVLIGVGGIFIAAWLYVAGRAAIRPLADPRLDEALAFENI